MSPPNRPNLLILALAAAFGATASVPAAAQETTVTPAPSSATLPAVKVRANTDGETAKGPVDGYLARRTATATKTDTALIETPQSVSVVTADFIDTIGAKTVKDALTYTAGVDVATNGTDSRFDWLTLRGFDAYTPGFYLDGLPMRNIGSWALWQIEPYGAERIELLRGPSSVLYGQSGPGGLINAVSKRPTAEPVRELRVELGEYQRRVIAGDFAGALDDRGELLYRLTALGRDAEMPAGEMDDDRTFIAPSITWRPSTDTTLTLLSQYVRTRAGVYTRGLRAIGSLVPTPAGTYLPTDTFTGEPAFNQFDQDQYAVGYEFEHRFNDVFTFRQNARATYLDTDLKQVQGGSYLTVTTPAADPANFRIVRRNVFTSREKVRSNVIDTQLQAKVRTGQIAHTLLIGVDYQHGRFDQTTGFGAGPTLDMYNPVYGSPVNQPAPYQNSLTQTTQTGLYVQDQAKWGRWAVTLGGRYDDAKAAFHDRLDNNNVTELPDHAFTGRAGIVYVHPSGLAPYFSYTESFTPTNQVDPLTGQVLDSETGKQYEVGVRYQPANSAQSYSASIFDLRRQNYVTQNPVTMMPEQTGEVTVRGFEFEATVRPLAGWNIVGAYAYTPKAEITQSSVPAEIGKQLMPVPENRASLWTDYRFDFGLKFGVGARYSGSNHGKRETAPAKVPAYTVFDAMAGYEFERWNLAVNVRNAGDKTYIANCGDGSCYYGEPRSVVASATYRW